MMNSARQIDRPTGNTPNTVDSELFETKGLHLPIRSYRGTLHCGIDSRTLMQPGIGTNLAGYAALIVALAPVVPATDFLQDTFQKTASTFNSHTS